MKFLLGIFDYPYRTNREREEKTLLCDEHIKAASRCEVIIAVVGESSSMRGEASSRMELHLPGRQEELLKELRKTGKLVTTFPYSLGQVPVYYNHPMTGRPEGKIKFTSKYIDGPAKPLYPFGFGLSYTTFVYENMVISSSEVFKEEKINVSVELTNTGALAGEEILQLYMTDVAASRVRPVKELKGFKKVLLQPGECRTVEFELSIHELGFYNENMEYVVEPGVFKICVGPSSKEGLEAELVVMGTK